MTDRAIGQVPGFMWRFMTTRTIMGSFTFCFTTFVAIRTRYRTVGVLEGKVSQIMIKSMRI